MPRRLKQHRTARNIETMEEWTAGKLAYCIERGWVDSWPLEVTAHGFRALRERRDHERRQAQVPKLNTHWP